MSQSQSTFKSFDARPGHTACRLPPLIERLAGELPLPAYFSLGDLREMSKFREIPNVHGLAAYRIENPVAGDFAKAIMPIAELPAGVERPCRNRFAGVSWVMTQGILSGIGGQSFSVRLLVPQSHAHLAAAMKRMLFAWQQAVTEALMADYTLLVWPEAVLSSRGGKVVEVFIGHWPTAAENQSPGEGLVIGYDDPKLICDLVDDAFFQRSGHAANWSRRMKRGADLGSDSNERKISLAIGSWLFGIEDDGTGHFPVLENPGAAGAGFVIRGE